MSTPEKFADLKLKAMDIAIGDLEAELKSTNPDVTKVSCLSKIVNTKAEAYVEALMKLQDVFSKKDDDDNFMLVEKTLGEVQFKVSEVDMRTAAFLQTAVIMSTPAATDVKVHLPQLKLQEFSGDLRRWLPFWAGFDEIHQKPNLTNTEKFQYLLQCLPANSDARKCVDCFPVSGGNYQSAVDALKKTFGREKVLVKVYVRDLLQLVIQNATQKSAVDVLELVPQLSSQIKNLEQLGVTSDKCESVLYPIVESSLPDEVLQAWQRAVTHSDKLKDLLEFLESEVQQQMERRLAKMNFAPAKISEKKVGKKDKVEVATASCLFSSTEKVKSGLCIFCEKGKHSPRNCHTAKSWPLKQREDALRKKNACYKCLKVGHFSSNCDANVVCGQCQGSHSEIMCRGSPQPRQESLQQRAPQNQVAFLAQPGTLHSLPPPPDLYQVPFQQPPSGVPFVNVTNPTGNGTSTSVIRSDFANTNNSKKVGLMTMVVKLDTPGGPSLARVFVDDGSEESYIEERVARAINCQHLGGQTIHHQVFSGMVTQPQYHAKIQIKISSIDLLTTGSYVFNTIPKIANGIQQPSPQVITALSQKGVQLHDQSAFGEEIHILVGMDIASQIWTGGFLRLSPHITAHETKFGWVVGGTQPGSAKMSSTSCHMVTSFMVSQLKEEDLWSLEALGIMDDTKLQSRKDLEDGAVAHFKNTVTRTENGRYVVSLPWLDGHGELQSNRPQALARLSTTTRKLKSEGHYQEYDRIFKQWLSDGIIEEAPRGHEDGKGYFLPHRHVVKTGSTTPIRPVFDASAKTKGGVSLNDCLEKGPNLLEMIPAIMTRFRLHQIGCIADIQKAFLQMSVIEKDRVSLQFLWWRSDTCDDLVVYRHARVPFGVTSSPFLLAITLQHHLQQYLSRHPAEVSKLANSMYVDNCVASCCSFAEAQKFKDTVTSVLQEGQFNLRGWEFGPRENEKNVPVLGMNWNTKTDKLTLCLDNTLEKLKLPSTKRGLLAAVNSIFDPMGFSAPFTLIPKLLFQKCCTKDLKIKWDDPLPEEIANFFTKWKDQVPLLQNLEVTRWMTFWKLADGNVSLQVFSDASTSAFSCCCYLRTENDDGTGQLQLIMSKSRVAPSKTRLTIPRLELMGCLIAARLAVKVKQYLELEDIPTYFWTDSSTALAWITNDKVWARFVGNRVEEIRKLSNPIDWKHVPGDLNPADLPSRGCSAKKLLLSKWWEGKEWMMEPKEKWPISNVIADDNEVQEELKRTVVTAHVKPSYDTWDNLKKFSDFHKVLRVVATVLLYIRKLKNKVEIRKIGFQQQQPTLNEFSTELINAAEVVVLQYIQRTGFTGSSDKRLQKLDSFVDGSGVMRVKTQLYFGSDDAPTRCPAVLPPQHELVKALIHTEHSRNSHAGVITTMAILRERYWILKARRSISGIISKCGKCRRFVSRRCQVPSVPLPVDRIRDTHAFDVTGVDLLGPLYLRGKEKIWVVLFTCAVFLSVHLGVTNTVSTEGFIRAFRRFVDRRTRPSKVYSDNGLNFTGTNNLFQKIDWMEVQRYAAVSRIQWVFNPPTAAWWGGFFERLVGLTKTLLRRILGKSVVNLEEFQTILCDVEATLNKRPLGYIGDVYENLVPLTPSHFMMGVVSSGLPEADHVDNRSLNECVRRVQKVREALRTRFRKEYLGQLKHVAGNKETSVGPGDVVIVEFDDRKRLDWPLGVVKSVYPGRDGKIRTALVRIKSGELLRPIQRLYFLESAVSESPPEVKAASCCDNAQDMNKTKMSRFGRKLTKPDRLVLKK